MAIVRPEDSVIARVKIRQVDKTEYLPRPLRPGIIPSSSNRGPREQFKIRDRFRTMAHGRADAIIASITTTNDNDIFALGIDVATVLKLGIQKRFSIQLIHIEKNSSEKDTSRKEMIHTCKNSIAK
jgi:hypothetical protein